MFRKLLLLCGLTISLTGALHAQNWKKEFSLQNTTNAQYVWLVETLQKNVRFKEQQPEMLDELLLLAERMKSDTALGMANLQLGRYYVRFGEMEYGWEALQDAKKHYLKSRYFQHINLLLTNQCIILQSQGLHDSMVRFLDSNHPLISLAPDKRQEMNLLYFYPIAYMSLGKKDKAIKEFRHYLILAAQLQDTSLLISTYSNLGKLQESFDSSMYFYNQGLELSKINYPSKYAEMLFHIGYLYAHRDANDRDSSLHYFLLLEKHIDNLSSVVWKSQAENMLAEFFMGKKEFSLALPHFRKAYAYSASITGTETNMIVHNLALCFLQLKQMDSTRFYLDIYKKKIAVLKDDYDMELYHNAMSIYLAATGDSCSPAVIGHINQALKYASAIEETRLSLSLFKTGITCLLRNKGMQKAANEMLAHCAFFYPVLKKSDLEDGFGLFLLDYARLQSAYGNKDKAAELYEEFALQTEKTSLREYLQARNDVLIQYKAELQEAKLAYAGKKNTLLSIGAIMLLVAGLIVFGALWNSIRQKKQIALQKQELQQLNHVKDRLFSVISHDLRAPVNNLISFTRLLDMKAVPAEKMTLYIDGLKSSLGHTSSMMENLLNWARSQMQGYHPMIEQCDLEPLSNEVCTQLATEAVNKNITFNNTISKGTYVLADQNMCALILRNLLSNAIKYSHADSVITIGAETLNTQVRFYVADNGTGMNESDVTNFNSKSMQHIESQVGTKNEKGTGLGLMLCKTFASLMNGSMRVESEKGTGSTFTVTLPGV